jgi:Mor family transcriptional regulator
MGKRDEAKDPMNCDPVELLVDYGEDLPSTEKWPAMLRNLVAVLLEYNRRVLKMSNKQASEDAQERVFLIAHYFGGKFLYLPRGDRLRSAVRNALISRLAATLSTSEIAEQFGLSEVMVYRIISQAPPMEDDGLRGRLFDEQREEGKG